MNLIMILSKVPDFRVQARCDYPLHEILGIALCATIAGAEDFTDIAAYGEEKQSLLGQLFELKNGIPSHDTFRRVFELLDPKNFQAVLQEFSAQLVEHLQGKHICIDGKGIHGTSIAGKQGNTCLTILSAWVSEYQLVLAQEAVSEKSNEITAIPKLLEQLELRGTTVTIDAIACQKNIAAQIADAGGTYILAVKENQGTLFREIKGYFDKKVNAPDFDKQFDFGHGRIETRTCYLSTDLTTIHVASLWKGLTNIIKVIARREFKNKDKVEQKDRYYISNGSLSPQKVNQCIRNHWGIENQLHWQLDVTFKEDANSVSNRTIAQNFNTLRKLALQILQQDKKHPISKKSKRKKAAWNDQYLLFLLQNFKS